MENSSSKIKTELSYDPAILLLCVYIYVYRYLHMCIHKENRKEDHKETCTSMFIATLYNSQEVEAPQV